MDKSSVKRYIPTASPLRTASQVASAKSARSRTALCRLSPVLLRRVESQEAGAQQKCRRQPRLAYTPIRLAPPRYTAVVSTRRLVARAAATTPASELKLQACWRLPRRRPR